MADEASDKPDLRNRLLDAGRAVFARSGHAAATVDDVIVEAATSRATFYRYFKSKDDLFVELSRECLRDLEATIGDVKGIGAGGDPRQDLEVLLERYRQVHARHSGVFRAWWERNARLEPDVRNASRSVMGTLWTELEGALEGAEVPSTVDRAVQAALLYMLIERSYYAVSSRWSRVAPERLAETLATMLHRAYFGGEVDERAPRLRVGNT